MNKYCMYLPLPMMERLKKLSKEKEMPVSELVRRFVDAGLKEEKKPEIYKQDENTTSLSSE